MLNKKFISNIQIYSDDWIKIRLGRFTSSNMHYLMGDKITMSYVYQKVGEMFTGVCTATGEESIENENTAWGNMYEPEALNKFGLVKRLKYLVTQKVICDQGSKFSSTPDAIWVHGECLNKEEYNVSTVEVKCPPTYNNYIPLKRCKIPADLKKFSKKYYWQVLDQMDNCGSAVGYFMCYHPLFPEGANYNIIEFKKMELWDDFKLMNQRKKDVLIQFDNIKQEVLSV